ncbi:MAG: hypothetical protein J07HX5_00543 [halophilic archaeon J07HX5]|nr:MAG: hypothetical protein J07HX5_00543 [halophilic archaeon J07HX5]
MLSADVSDSENDSARSATDAAARADFIPL